jgi:UDP-N-acetylglucosamine diphosphorylase/glucosamine-1-phosphate N-acetyltransferase
MQLILFDTIHRDRLLPLAFTRPASDLRVGILTITEKWEQELGMASSFLTADYLQGKYPCQPGEDNLLVNGMLLPDDQVVSAISSLEPEQALLKEGVILAVRTSRTGVENFGEWPWMDQGEEYDGSVSLVDRPWFIFALNGREIEADYRRLTHNRVSGRLSPTVRVDEPDNVFVEEGFRGENFTLNASLGRVYLGKDSEIMEGCMIRGPFALCEGSVVKMGAKIYGATTIGPHSKVGGEVNNSVIFGYSNKGHDGFLGNSVLGEWCNIGADSNNSNLKNNYDQVKLWSYVRGGFERTGEQFCGLMMADHSKCGINTMFNTGTVVGVSANIFGPGFPPTFVPSFSWGGADGFQEYRLSKAMETANLVMERRGMQLSQDDRAILNHISKYSKAFSS